MKYSLLAKGWAQFFSNCELAECDGSINPSLTMCFASTVINAKFSEIYLRIPCCRNTI